MIRTCLLLGLLLALPLAAAPRVLQIGVIGPMDGAAGALLSRQCAEVSAELVNEQGGLLVGRDRYRVEVLAGDSGGDPYQAMRAQRAMANKGVRYFIGPFSRPALRLVVGVGEITGALNIAYADDDGLYGPKRRYLVYGEVPSRQRIPALYHYLARQGIKSVAFIARNDAASLANRNTGIAVAGGLGMALGEPRAARIDDITYAGEKSPPLYELLEDFAALATDAIVLTDVRGEDAASLIQGLRRLGYRGVIATDHHLPAASLEAAGRAAEGFLALGVTPGAETWSDYRKAFIKRFKARFGTWPDEAGSRAYAAEFLLRMIQVTGPSALKNTRSLRGNMHDLPLADPFFRNERELRLIGGKRYGRNVQLNVPVVVKEIYDGRYRTRHVHEPS